MPRKRSKHRILASQQEVAKFFGVSRAAIAEWRQRANPMPGERGRYDTAKIQSWYEKEFPTRNGTKSEKADDGAVSSLNMRLKEAQIAKEEAAAVLARHKARAQSAEYISVTEVNEFVAEFFAADRRNLLRIPVEFAAGYPRDIRSQIEEELTQRLELHLIQMRDFVLRSQEL